MLVYRIVNKQHKNSILSGIGAEKFGGRWNEVGTRAVYCSESISLALLEYYVHCDNVGLLPKKIVVAKIEIPDNIIFNELKSLPKKWDQYPYSSKSTKAFTELAKSIDFFGLKVPSSVVPLEFNYVLNPLYKDFGKIQILDFIDLSVDQRLKK